MTWSQLCVRQRSLDAWRGDDWDAYLALYAPAYVLEDRRSMTLVEMTHAECTELFHLLWTRAAARSSTPSNPDRPRRGGSPTLPR